MNSAKKPASARKSSTPMLCGHCGRHSVFQVRSEGTQRGETPFADSRDANSKGFDGQTITTWRVLECSICHQPTLVQEAVEYTYNDDWQGNPTIDAADTTVLYPKTATRTALADLPPVVAEEYEAAIQVRDISLNACAVLLRRTLEAICNHEKAGGSTLEEMVNNLLRSSSIPRLLADMAHLGRHIGNVGAHAGQEATEEDVTVLSNFIDVILLYLYTTPTKVTAFKERLKKIP